MYGGVLAWTRWTSRNFDAGKPHHGWVAWGLAVFVPTVLALGVHWLLVLTLGLPFAVLWSIAVLYVTLGFRQFSHHFTGIRDALDEGDEPLARSLLAHWQHVDAADLPRSEIVRHVIEHSVIAAHRHVFGVLAWFSILAAVGLGPAGAVFYRMSEFVSRYWAHKNGASMQPSSVWVAAGGRARLGGYRLAAGAHHRARLRRGRQLRGRDRLLAQRCRALSQRERRRDPGRDLGRASTCGWAAACSSAVPLTDPLSRAQAGDSLAGGAGPDSGSTPGREPEPAHLRSVVGLVWRSVVMWMVLLALLTLARLLG